MINPGIDKSREFALPDFETEMTEMTEMCQMEAKAAKAN